MCRSVTTLSKIIHQMSHDHPFSQKNKTTKKAVEMEVGGDGEGVVVQILKSG